MTELRINFERYDEVKYISHLDVLKLFDRALRRGNINVSHTKGFNPHPIIVFGLPMGVGLSSLSEFADITLDSNMSTQDFVAAINASLPQSFRVTGASVKTAKGNIMAQIEAASYEVTVGLTDKNQADMIMDKHVEFLANDAIMFEKESKKGKKEIDIRPLILESNISILKEFDETKKNEFIGNNTIVVWNMLLKASQTDYLKPENFMRAFCKFSCIDLKTISIKRTASFAAFEGELVSPLDNRIILQPG